MYGRSVVSVLLSSRRACLVGSACDRMGATWAVQIAQSSCHEVLTAPEKMRGVNPSRKNIGERKNVASIFVLVLF